MMNHIPPQLLEARIKPGESALPSNREAQRALATVVMLGKQLASQLEQAEPVLKTIVARAEHKPAWQTEFKRAGLDPEEVVDFCVSLLVLLRGGPQESGGRPAETTLGKISPADDGS